MRKYVWMYDRMNSMKERSIITMRNSNNEKNAVRMQAYKRELEEWKKLLNQPRLYSERVKRAIRLMIDRWFNRGHDKLTFHMT